MDSSGNHNMYYIALVCPPETNKKIEQFKLWMKEQFGCIVALKSPGHITLIPPFWLDNTREATLQETLQSFKASLGNLKIELDGFSHFNKRVLFVQVKENLQMEKLQKQADEHFKQSFSDAIRKDQLPFHAHVTIANRDMKPFHFEMAWQYFSVKEFHEKFFIKTISLLRLNMGKWGVIGEKEWEE